MGTEALDIDSRQARFYMTRAEEFFMLQLRHHRRQGHLDHLDHTAVSLCKARITGTPSLFDPYYAAL